MRTRLAAQRGGGNRGSSSTSAAAHTPLNPNAPKNGAVLLELVRDIERNYNLGLDTSDRIRSPSEKTSTNLANIVLKKINQNFWIDDKALDERLQVFHELASKRTDSQAKLRLLDRLLPDFKTPNSIQRTTRTPEPARVIKSPTINTRSCE